MRSSAFQDLLQSIAERGRRMLQRQPGPGAGAEDLPALAESILSGRGEASGTALASVFLDSWQHLDSDERLAFFQHLASGFGPDHARIASALAAYRDDPNDATAMTLHEAAEPRRQELFRRLNRAPRGTARLVAMRAELLPLLRQHRELAVVDRDFEHLLASWFNRGFLVLNRIDWNTPAAILERIIQYEAVHEIRSWEDLRRRIEPADRRCFAFFHPALRGRSADLRRGGADPGHSGGHRADPRRRAHRRSQPATPTPRFSIPSPTARRACAASPSATSSSSRWWRT